MRIGIDIDGVLTDVERYNIDHFSKYCIKNKIEFKIEPNNYNLFKIFNVLKEHENSFWNESLFPYAKEHPIRPFASEVIKNLKNKGHEIYIITARSLTNKNTKLGEEMRNTVKAWLDSNDVYYDKLIFSKGDNETKLNEITEEKIDLMIEDNPNNIIELSKIIPVLCYNASYNVDCKGNNIIRVYSWYDIYQNITNLKME